MKRVTFIRNHRMYQPGEDAGFPIQQADELIKAGVAVDTALQKKQQAEAAEAKAKADADAAAAEAKEKTEADAKAAADAASAKKAKA